MRQIARILIITSFGILTGCASSHMTAISDSPEKLTPAPGKALVVFARTTSFGGAIQATLYDNDEYIGTISADTKIAYQAEPGKHMFMVIGESADFMEADLMAGKTYYSGVIVRPGFWKARFSFHPNNRQISDKELKNWISGTKLVEPNDKGQQWASQNAKSIKKLKDKYLPAWNAKKESDKQRLHRSSGY